MKVVNFTPVGASLTTSGFKVIWLLSFILLANNTPYLSNVMEWLRLHIPLFAEAYRFPFTKFGLLFGFSELFYSFKELASQGDALRSNFNNTHSYYRIPCISRSIFL